MRTEIPVWFNANAIVPRRGIKEAGGNRACTDYEHVLSQPQITSIFTLLHFHLFSLCLHCSPALS